MQEVTEVCDRVLVLQRGTIIAHDTPENLAATVSSVHVELTIVEGLERAINYAQGNALVYTVKDRLVTIEVDEHAIAKLLAELAQLGINYSHISINKPTLEDYFLHIAQQTRLA